MNEVWCRDLVKGKDFILKFNDLHKQRVFLLRCRYSKKIMVLGYTWQTESQYQYLQYGR